MFVGLPSSPIKSKSVKGFLSYARTNKQTDKQRYDFICRYQNISVPRMIQVYFDDVKLFNFVDLYSIVTS